MFTAHSIPLSMAAGASPWRNGYEVQLRRVAGLVADRVGRTQWDLVWQSRSGPPHVPWLEPDVCDHLRALAKEGVAAVVLVPIGFVTDHMEVVYDLDVEAADVARELGIALTRAATAGTHPRFAEMVADLLAEPEPVNCPDLCCPAPARPGRP